MIRMCRRLLLALIIASECCACILQRDRPAGRRHRCVAMLWGRRTLGRLPPRTTTPLSSNHAAHTSSNGKGAPNHQALTLTITSAGEEQYLAGTSAKLVPLVSEFYGSSATRAPAS
jgi:hypothetical protein